MDENIQPPHEKSLFSIKTIRVVDFSFKQINNVINGLDNYQIDYRINPKYCYLENNSNMIQLNFIMKTIVFQKKETEKVVICEFNVGVVGVFSYKGDKINKKLLPNLVSILYSYSRPLVAQLSAMAKLPPVDLPILDLSDINVEEDK